MKDTTRGRIIRGLPDSRGWVDLRYSQGESHPPAPPGRPIAALWHFSDLHLCDVDSPGRLEYLDRYSDPDSPLLGSIGDVGTYRPQELFTVHVALTMFQAITDIRRAPLTKRSIDAVLVTGDITDNAQANELDWYIRILDGGIIHGGDFGGWVGNSSAGTWDERYWHPDGPPANFKPDIPTRIYGFPSKKDLISAAREPLISPGIDLPVISVHGNHDALIQGTIPPRTANDSVLLSSEHVISLGRVPHLNDLLTAVAPIGPAALPPLSDARTAPVLARSDRRYLRPSEFARTTGQLARYSIDRIGGIHVIVLDTVNPHGGWQGSLDAQQFEWLTETLSALESELTVITSHHPSFSMTNDYAPSGRPRILGSEVLQLLLSHPNVIAWLAGHVHANHIVKHASESGHVLWEITTASLIDWPQQARIVEFIDCGDEVVIAATMVDHEAPLEAWSSTRVDPRALASISRSLAANDYHDRAHGGSAFAWREGSPGMRNCVLRTSRKLPHLDSNQKPFD